MSPDSTRYVYSAEYSSRVVEAISSVRSPDGLSFQMVWLAVSVKKMWPFESTAIPHPGWAFVGAQNSNKRHAARNEERSHAGGVSARELFAFNQARAFTSLE